MVNNSLQEENKKLKELIDLIANTEFKEKNWL